MLRAWHGGALSCKMHGSMHDSRRLNPGTYLSIENVSVAYDGTRVLSEVTLDVARGELRCRRRSAARR